MCVHVYWSWQWADWIRANGQTSSDWKEYCHTIQRRRGIRHSRVCWQRRSLFAWFRWIFSRFATPTLKLTWQQQQQQQQIPTKSVRISLVLLFFFLSFVQGKLTADATNVRLYVSVCVFFCFVVFFFIVANATAECVTSADLFSFAQNRDGIRWIENYLFCDK